VVEIGTTVNSAVLSFDELLSDIHFLGPEMLSVFILSYLLFPCQSTHCQMIHEERQKIQMRSNVRE
jgi:hypothetical protein